MTQLQFNLVVAKDLKEAGQQRAREHSGNPWVGDALEVFRDWLRMHKGESFRFEQFRAWYTEALMPPPASHKVWGALPAIAARLGLIEFTGQYELAHSIKTHAHAVKLWRAL